MGMLMRRHLAVQKPAAAPEKAEEPKKPAKKAKKEQ